MKALLRPHVLVVVILLLAGGWTPLGAQPAPPPLSPVVVSELKVLEETYALLDAVADKAWPGWSGYKDVPFLFEFENNLRVLVGHPNPPKPFEIVPGLTVGGHSVAADRSTVTTLELKPYLSGGGGPIGFGASATGSSVYTVRIHLSGRRDQAEEAAANTPPTTEEKVLIYLHELFHCYARGRIEPQYGNLRFNPDADYSTWSQVEGLALERAYRATDPAAARERLKEFVVARALKRTSMTPDQQGEESADDVREGTATYVMLRALELIKAGGFQPRLTTAEDPYYHGFADASRMIDQYLERLVTAAGRHDDPKMKCYDYGCFQCALSQRLFPGWQKAVEGRTPMDAVIARELAIADADRPAIERRLRTDYPVDRIQASARAFTGPRDAAYGQVTARQGRVYVVDLKAIHTFVNTLVDQKAHPSHRLGLLALYTAGYPGFRLDQVEMSAAPVPMMTDQLYYLRLVDTDWKGRTEAFSVSGTKQPDGTYRDAVVTTPLFTLRAPRLRVKESGTRVKIQVLDRVGGR